MGKTGCFKVAVYTETGSGRRKNQDAVLVKTARADGQRVLLAAVCDGMGGLAKGEVASGTLICMISQWFDRELPALLWQGLEFDQLKKSWTELLEQANKKILRYGTALGREAGTTAAILLWTGGRYYWCSVGDSRIYRMGKRAKQLTGDHSLVQREVRAGRMTGEQAKRDPRRSILLQGVGVSQSPVPDYNTGTAGRRRAFLLCSDGFWHWISPKEMELYLVPGRLAEDGEIREEKMKEGLAGLAELGRRRGEKDDCSAVLICGK